MALQLALLASVVVQLTTQPGAALLQQRPDSQEVRDAARSAQRRFEQVRRQYLPSTTGGLGSSCDERVGRFCFWHDDDPPWEPQPEHARVTAARNRLLHELDSVATLLPGDEWIVGQRVRYLVEAERWDDALEAAQACRAATWWCGLLAGFVRHSSGDFAAADSAFGLALAASPTELRCAWTDLSQLLDGDLEPSYRDASCGDRHAVNRRIWWLADPLYLVPGNERRTEHFARVVVDRLMHDAANPYGLRWGRDNRELTMRYGWTVGWERARFGSSSLNTRPQVIGHHAPGSKHFVPRREYVSDASRIAPGTWDLEPERPRTRYAPRYLVEFGRLEPEVAVFRRGDSMLVVTAFNVQEMRTLRAAARSAPSPDSVIEVAVALASDEHAVPAVARAPTRGATARLIGRAANIPSVLSIEALYRADSVAARERYWLAREPDDEGLALSDLLLVDADSLPDTLDEAAPLARPTATFEPGEIIHVYWEVYGIPAGASGAVSLTVVKEGKSFFRKAVEFLGLAGGDKPTVRLEWVEAPAAARGGVGRSVSLQLPEEQEGSYTIRLEAVLASGERATATKQILVEEP